VGRLAKLAFGSDNASRLPPTALRCSAPLKGPNTDGVLRSTGKMGEKAGRPHKKRKKTNLAVDGTKAIFSTKISAVTFSRFPVFRAEQRRRAGGFRLALSEARRAEFSQPPGPSSRAGESAARRPRKSGSPSFGYFSWRSKKSMPARQARNPAFP
ncbi:MAG: hypothetical protein LWW83_04700, partial [Azonexaceae bacterium]|nr:hypothetical protein [Azonexaceae bacterium]